MLTTRESTESISRSERVRRTWLNPDRRIKQSEALKRCWHREDYRTRLSEHLREISPKGVDELGRLRKAGMITISDEARQKMSEGQKRRFQRPEELKKLARARSLQVIDYKERAKLMNRAFLKKYGSFLELTKMGLKATRRKPNRLEIEVAKMLGSEWLFVGKGDLVVGGLILDFVHKERKEIIEVLGCYFHACPAHFPNVRIERTARPEYRDLVYTRYGYKVTFLWEHTVKERRKLAFAESGVKDPSIYASG